MSLPIREAKVGSLVEPKSLGLARQCSKTLYINIKFKTGCESKIITPSCEKLRQDVLLEVQGHPERHDVV